MNVTWSTCTDTEDKASGLKKPQHACWAHCNGGFDQIAKRLHCLTNKRFTAARGLLLVATRRTWDGGGHCAVGVRARLSY